MIDLAKPIQAAYKNADFSVQLQLTGLSQEAACVRARGEQGSSIAWNVGHLLIYRAEVLTALGVPTEDRWSALFAFATPATNGSGYPPITQLHAEWTELQGKLITALDNATADQLTAPGDNGKPLFERFAYETFHEAYHVGCIGMLRAQQSLKRTHELAIEAMQKTGQNGH